MPMVHDILFAFWFLLPAAAANAAPVVAATIPWLKPFDWPLDGGRTFRGKELFGRHKTWRGIVSGVVVATLVLWLQQLLVRHTGWGQSAAQGVNYAAFPTLLLGPLFAFGALGGDAVESFFKRQHGIKSGASWLLFDQLDYVIGAIIVTVPFVILTPVEYSWMIIVWFFMHLLVSYIGWRLGIKERPI